VVIITKEIVYVEMPVKNYDMSKSDLWTKEQWDEWHDDHYKSDEWFLQLLQDEKLNLKITLSYYNEVSHTAYFRFEGINKETFNMMLLLTKWEMDGAMQNITDDTVVHLPNNYSAIQFDKGISFPAMGKWEQATLHFHLINADTKEQIQSLVIQITKRYKNMFPEV